MAELDEFGRAYGNSCRKSFFFKKKNISELKIISRIFKSDDYPIDEMFDSKTVVVKV